MIPCLQSLIAQVSSLTERMERLVRKTQRIRIEMEDNPHRHLRPCSACGKNETRFGICADCESGASGNGHSKP